MHEKIVDSFWACFDKADFFSASKFLADDLQVIWPTSREMFTNAESFIAMNVAFPGRWNFKKHKLMPLSNIEYLSIMLVTSPDAEEQFYATSIMAVEAGLIRKIETYWAQLGQQPEWRQQYSQLY